MISDINNIITLNHIAIVVAFLSVLRYFGGTHLQHIIDLYPNL